MPDAAGQHTLLAPSGWHVLRAVQPQILAAIERLVPCRHEVAVLLLADRVHRLADAVHDVETIEDHLRVRLRNLGPRRLDVGLPHVHRHRLDAVELLGHQPCVVAVKTRLGPAFGNVLHRALVQVADQRPVAMALGRLVLIDADAAHNPHLLAGAPPRDCSLHHHPRFVPADPQDSHAPVHVALAQHVDGEAFEQLKGQSLKQTPTHTAAEQVTTRISRSMYPGKDPNPMFVSVNAESFSKNNIDDKTKRNSNE